jgi:putative SOS response-associated peptidase YedK
LVLEFRPRPQQDMLVACLWSAWSAPGEPDLLSFAAITDEPPVEIAAVGHDRCIIPIKPENVDAWLKPDRANLQASHAIPRGPPAAVLRAQGRRRAMRSRRFANGNFSLARLLVA